LIMDSQEEFGQIRKGLLEFAVLKVVSAGRVYSAEIIERLANTDFKATEGSLYPLLSRMRRDGTLDYEWVESESGPPRKYYSLTVVGRRRLTAMSRYWNKLHKSLTKLGAKDTGDE
jgi:PadR family transcriptional regulator, regulatory protein PadR